MRRDLMYEGVIKKHPNNKPLKENINKSINNMNTNSSTTNINK
jgi:hypothetical protein